MATRGIVLLLILVLTWSGFTTQEKVFSIAAPSAPLVDVAGLAQSPFDQDDGSVEDHHLDDQPGQLQGAADLPAFAMTPPEADAPGLTMSKPRPYELAAWFTPFLDGPQRPPCA